jgi:hypothetical protein
MLLPSLALVAAVASSAQAFLIPSLNSDAVAALAIRPHEEGRLIKVPCPGCPFAEGTSWTNIPNSLILKFHVDSNDQNTLKLNGAPLYPVSMFPAMLKAPQIHADLPLVDFNPEKSVYQALRLGYKLSIHPLPRADPNSDEEEIQIKFHVLEIQDKFVEGVPSVQIVLVKNLKTGSLQLRSSDLLQSLGHGAIFAAPMDNECRLGPIICKLKEVFGKKFNIKFSGMRAKFRGCHKARPHHQLNGAKASPHAQAHNTSSDPAPSQMPSHPLGHGHGHGRPHRHHQHGFAAFVNGTKRVVAHFFVPVMIGIAAGMTASIIGMIVGRLMVLLWRRFAHGQKPQSYFVLTQEEPSTMDEDMLKADLPAYEDTETVQVVVVEEVKV